MAQPKEESGALLAGLCVYVSARHCRLSPDWRNTRTAAPLTCWSSSPHASSASCATQRSVDSEPQPGMAPTFAQAYIHTPYTHSPGSGEQADRKVHEEVKHLEVRHRRLPYLHRTQRAHCSAAGLRDEPGRLWRGNSDSDTPWVSGTQKPGVGQARGNQSYGLQLHTQPSPAHTNM